MTDEPSKLAQAIQISQKNKADCLSKYPICTRC